MGSAFLSNAFDSNFFDVLRVTCLEVVTLQRAD